MIYRYRNYSHASNEVDLEVTQEATYDQRGIRRGTKVQHKLTGYLQAATAALLTTAANNMKAAYLVQGGNAGLYEESGAVTTHFLNSGLATLSGGVRVVSGPNFPSEPGVYSTYLKYDITLEAEFPVAQNSDLMFFRETIEITGTGGPRWVMIETRYGPPQKQIVSQRTPIRAVQSGSAVGFSGYPKPPGPIWPTAEHEELRSDGAEGPVVVNGRVQQFGKRWTYIYESATPLAGQPTVR